MQNRNYDVVGIVRGIEHQTGYRTANYYLYSLTAQDVQMLCAAYKVGQFETINTVVGTQDTDSFTPPTTVHGTKLAFAINLIVINS